MSNASERATAHEVEMEPMETRVRRAPLAYVLIRWLFRFVLKVFYSQVIVEGSSNMTPDGIPAFLVANHANSLTDALLMVTTVPSTRRKLLRLTAKDTQFGRKTFTSWLIESAGTLPIKRPKDHTGQKVDNSVVFAELVKALSKRGDMVVMFPEGMSRFHPELAPLKQGVSRIASDVLIRNKDKPGFQVAIQPCSINYLHRNLFRSDVLVTFHPAIVLSPQTHPGLLDEQSPAKMEEAVRSLTNEMRDKIRSGLLEAPSWNYIRAAATARRLYAPLGTRLGLGDHVRLTQRFVDAFVGKKATAKWDEGLDPKDILKTPMLKTPKPDGTEGAQDYFGNGAVSKRKGPSSDQELEELRRDLETYQSLLWLHGIKDDRVRNPRLSKRTIIIKRLLVRVIGAAFLLAISLPGLALWSPVFVITKYEADKLTKSGPSWDTYDEIAQTKLVYGLLTYCAVYVLTVLLTLPVAPLTAVLVPVIMWVTLRWIEDCTSSIRAALALFRLLLIGKRELNLLRDMREGLRQRVIDVAERDCGLPRDADKYLEHRGKWRGLSLGFFSLQRRRKKDWQETLKLFDVTEYPPDDPVMPILS